MRWGGWPDILRSFCRPVGIRLASAIITVLFGRSDRMLLLEGTTGATRALTFAPDGNTLAVGTAKGSVRLWNPLADLTPTNYHLDAVQALAYSPDGQYLVSGGADHTLSVWNTSTHQVTTTRLSEPYGITSVGFVGSRTVLFGIGERPGPVGRPTTMFMMEIGKPKWRPFPFRVVHGIRAIAADAERRLAVWATDVKQVHVQDITRQPARSQPLRNDCRALALSPDARWVVVAADWEVWLFDVTNWPTPPLLLGRHQGTISSLAFTPDSRTVLTGSWDKTVRLWDVERQVEKHCLTLSVGRIATVAVAPDGTRAAAAGDSGHVVIWDLEE